jgi:glycosyltransferase involved in cell wall biosynthesis
LRILHVIDSFSPDRGGPPEAVRQLVKAYAAEGLTTEVVCLDPADAPFLRDLPCKVYALGQSWMGQYAFSPRLWRWLRANAGRYHGIVMNGVWTFPGLALSMAARHARTPYGVFVHGALDPWFNRQYWLKRLKKRVYWPVQYSVLRHARAVFFTTSSERDLAKTSFSPSKWNSVVVPFGIIDAEESGRHAAAQVEEFYRRVPQVRRRPYLLFLGRLHEKKGCDLLLRAFAEIGSAATETDLVIAGPDRGGMQARLQQMAGQLGIVDRVHWPGMIGGDLKWGALRACDALILPSHQENFGVVVVEALAAGRPVLISHQVNIWPEIMDEGVGLADEDTLKGTIRLLSRWFDLSGAERDAMAARARPCFAAKFSMERALTTVNSVFAAGKAGS